MDEIEELQKIIDESESAVFFGGAGVSTESGIPDFRSADGIYVSGRISSPETVLGREFLYSHPDEFFRFYRDKMVYPGARPNAAHEFLARWEKTGRLKAVVTQNIDGLHQKAGSVNVLELHGSILGNYCVKCFRRYAADEVASFDGTPRCACGGLIRPDIVLYGEPLEGSVWNAALTAIENADTLIVGGTSLTVYPAAGLIRGFCGRKLVLINKSVTPYDEQADLVVRKPIAQTFSRISL